MFTLILLACTPPEKAPDSETPIVEDSGPKPPEPPAYSGGTCPTLVEGRNTAFTSGGEQRQFLLSLPEEPVGAPLLFAWHPLGGTASWLERALDLSTLADEEGVIIVTPDSCCSPTEWGFFPGTNPDPDLALFDDLLSCLTEQYQIDADRVYSTGFSAGALWTTYLGMHRSDYLAAIAPISGGTGDFMEHTPPTRPLAAMLIWGGPNDLYQSLSFQDATMQFSEELQAVGSFVGLCEHDGGHTIPSWGRDSVWAFLKEQRWSDTSAPFAEGFPEDFPGPCYVAAPPQ